MKKKQNAKDKVNLKSLKRLLKSFGKPMKAKNKVKAKVMAITPYMKRTALVALSVLLLASLISYDKISNYFSDIAEAVVFNLYPEEEIVLIQKEASPDELQNLSEIDSVFTRYNNQ